MKLPQTRTWRAIEDRDHRRDETSGFFSAMIAVGIAILLYAWFV